MMLGTILSILFWSPGNTYNDYEEHLRKEAERKEQRKVIKKSSILLEKQIEEGDMNNARETYNSITKIHKNMYEKRPLLDEICVADEIIWKKLEEKYMRN
jgi:hypothetical protein